MSKNSSTVPARKRLNSSTRWSRYILAGAMLAVLVASGISAQLFATTDAAQSSSIENARPTLYAHGDRLRPLVEETDGAQTLNIYGPGGQIIAQVARDGLGGSQKAPHLLADHLGSTRAILNADDNVVAHFEYGPHGETATSGVAAAEARYRYTGHPWDAAQGVYQTPARGYDPATGRFLSVDPQRQDASPYVYAGNNPVGFVDPTGGIKVPFFVFTGFNVELQRTGRRFSYEARAYGLKLGIHTAANQNVYSAAMFNSLEIPSSYAELNSQRLMLGQKNKFGDYVRDYQYNERMYFFVGGETTVDQMDRLEQGIQAFRRHLPQLASEVTIINFAANSSNAKTIRGRLKGMGMNPLLLDVTATGDIAAQGSGKKYVKYVLEKFTVGQDSYPPKDFAKYVHSEEDKFRQENNPTPMETESSSSPSSATETGARLDGVTLQSSPELPSVPPVTQQTGTVDPSVSQGTERVPWSELLFMEGPEFDAMYNAHLPPGMEEMEP